MLKLSLRGRLQEYTGIVERAAGGAVATVIRRRTTALKNAIRQEIIAAGLGEKLANAVRAQVWPERGGSLQAHGRVWSKAIYKRRGGFVDLFTTFSEGARITGSPYLAIPLVDLQSPKDARRRAHPGDYPEGTFGWRPTRRPGVYVLYWKGRPDDEVFVLFRTVNLRRRLNLRRHHAAAEAGLDAELARVFDRLVETAARKVA